MFVGPAISSALSDTQAIINGMPKNELFPDGTGIGLRNSDGRNTAEHEAAKAWYRMLIAPTMSIGLSALQTAGPLGWSVRAGTMLYGTSSSGQNAFADTVVGERDSNRRNINAR